MHFNLLGDGLTQVASLFNYGKGGNFSVAKTDTENWISQKLIMLEHSCKKHCIAPTWICAMGLVLELWDNFEFFADVPTHGHAHVLS